MNAIKKECLWFVLSFFVGVCVCFLMLPELILHPTHIDTEANQKMAFTFIALKNHMTINNTQITRENGASEVYNAQQEKRFFNNELLPDTLYIGLNDKQYPHQYCSQWDDYVVCSRMQLNHA